ncbi:MAG: hypothetical protein HKN36_03865 [Hellea sp.]|nr:hypothetical protein [Hellea sp.]
MSRKPNLIIAGAQKSGTSWLHAQLRQHPDIFMPAVKELNYFNRIGEVTADEYLAHFRSAGSERYVGEATPHYFWKRIENSPYCEPPGDFDVATEMHRFLDPGAQLIFSLRDPVSRAVSGWHHNMCMGRNPDRKGMLDCPPSMGIVDLGMYARHWDHFESLFGRERMHVVLYDDLERAPRDYLGWVLRLLELDADDEYFSAINLNDRINTKEHLIKRLPGGAELPKADPDEIKKLLEMYEPHIRRVEDISGRDLSNWRDHDLLVASLC